MRRFGLAAVLSLAPAALAGPATAFQLLLSNADFATAPEFGVVENFSFEIDLAGPLVAGASYDNDSIVLVQYLVRGRLSTNPPTPSGFSGFRLDRFPSGEGPISAADWIGQGSSIAFEVAASANLSDGLQLSELVPGAGGLLFELDAREFERLDRARYHPPLLQLFENGTGVLQNSNNSSGSTGTTNPGTGLTVDVDFGEEYITNLAFDPREITLVVPEPGTGLLLALGLGALAATRPAKRRIP
jgi:hypothetical protein